jgi:hypothetical protein
MVRIHPDPPNLFGAVAQLGEHLLCKQGVVGSIPISSTSVFRETANASGSCWPLAPGVSPEALSVAL